MNSSDLPSLIPRLIQVKTDVVTGEMRIHGSTEHNTIQFSFRFTDPLLEVSPLLLVVDAAGKIYRYYCTIQNKDNPAEMITPVFHPGFSVGQYFTLTAVEPLVRFIPKKI